MSLTSDTIANHRADLLAREQATMQQLARAWIQVESELRDSLDALTFQLAADGNVTTERLLLQSLRYQRLIPQVNSQLAQYSRFAEQAIVREQTQLVGLAINHSAALINSAALDAGIGVTFDRLPVEAVQAIIGQSGDGSPLASILIDASKAGTDGLRRELITGVALGRNPEDMARRAMRAGLGTTFTRTATIYRTEVLRAYRFTSLESYRRSGVVEKFARHSARDSRVCPGCLFSDGQIFETNQDFDAHPNCVIGGTVINSPTVLATSKRWFDGYVIEIRTINGNILTTTENHPILTDKGWIAAHLLNVGDNVIGSSDGQRTASSVDPNNYSAPSIIEEVIESFARSGGVTAVSVPSSSVDFHGDGGNGDVDIVRADSFLGNGTQPAVNQRSGKNLFGFGDIELQPLPRDGALAQFVETPILAPHGVVSGFRIGDVSPFVSLGHHKPIGFRASTNGDSGFFDLAANDATPDAVAGGESILGLAGQVQSDHLCDWYLNRFGGVGFACLSGSDLPRFGGRSKQSPFDNFSLDGFLGTVPSSSDDLDTIPGDVVTDRIIEVNRRAFSGHVYNLQTSTGWYIANGIITHNCRCSLIPIVKNYPLKIQTGQQWFVNQPTETQRQILGDGRYNLWAGGDVSLDAMVTRVVSPTWGGALVPTPVGVLRGEG